MGQIRSTTLATSNPLNLTNGFPLFPLGTSLNNPLSPQIIGLGVAPSQSFPIVETTIPLALWRLDISAAVQIIFGVFWGFNLEYAVDGETRENGTATLVVDDDSAAGGIGFGLGFTIGIELTLEEARVTFTWRSGFRTVWQEAFSATARATIDLIDITLQILRRAGVRVPLDRLRDIQDRAGSGAIWGLFDSATDQFANRGSLTLEPRLSFSGNILTAIPPLRPVLTAIEGIGGDLSAGPVLNIIFPIEIRIVRLTTEDGNYAASGFDAEGAFLFNQGPRRALGPNVQQVRITHSHTIRVRFLLEFAISFSLWRMFSIEAAVPIRLNTMVPASRPNEGLGPFFTTLSNDGQVAEVELPEVVWG